MRKKFLLLVLLTFPMMGLAWCEKNSDCPPGEYCSKHGVHVGNYCQKKPSGKTEHFTTPENLPLGLPFSEAVRVGDTVYLSGQIGIPPGKKELVPGGIGPESEQTLKNIGQVLDHFDLTYGDIVKCQAMLADISEWPAFNTVYKKYFQAPYYPARSAFAASGLAFGARIELECMAVVAR